MVLWIALLIGGYVFAFWHDDAHRAAQLRARDHAEARRLSVCAGCGKRLWAWQRNYREVETGLFASEKRSYCDACEPACAK